MFAEFGIVTETGLGVLLADGGFDDGLPVGAERGRGAGSESKGGLRVLARHFVDGEEERVEVFTGAGVLKIGTFAEEIAVINGDFVVLFPVGDGGEAGLFDLYGIEEAVDKDLPAAILDVRRKQPPILAQNQIGTEPHDANRKRPRRSMACSRMGFSRA